MMLSRKNQQRVGNLIYLLKSMTQYVFRLLPLQNKVVFINFRGRGMGDDPKYIALELVKRDIKGLDLLWLLSNTDNLLPQKIRAVKYGSIRAIYEMCTAKVWVNNSKDAFMVSKRKGQYYIQTWHGTIGLKKAEQAVPNLDNHYRKMAIRDAKQTDLMYANSDYHVNLFKTKFWYNGPVIKCDTPRTSVFYSDSEKYRIDVFKHYGISHNKKIVLYAPTFRQTGALDAYKYDYSKIKKLLDKKFGGDFCFFIRLHPNIADLAKNLDLSENIIDATDYPDMQELLSAVDVLITDFSGSMFEFSLIKRPAFLFAKDYYEFLKNEREMAIDLSKLPFTFAKSEEELWHHINTFDLDKYQTNCDRFNTAMGLEDKGHGSEAIADIIIKKIYG